jgi:glycosyltransferase involved in cell wall biosynthesis
MISIVIPVYNQADKIGKCLDSIIKQQYSDHEVIIVNDGSIDNISRITEIYRPKFTDDRFYFINQENRGANAARNKGATVAKGEYIIFCDADIVMATDMLIKMFEILQKNPQASYVYSSHRFGFKIFRLWQFDAQKLKQMPYIHTTSLIRKSDFPGFDESIMRLQDWDLWLTMLENGHEGFWIDEVLFTVASGGTMSNWLPSFTYKLLPFLPSVKKYKRSVELIKKKHKL